MDLTRSLRDVSLKATRWTTEQSELSPVSGTGSAQSHRLSILLIHSKGAWSGCHGNDRTG